MKPDEFIAAIAPAAIYSASMTAVPAGFTIAEAALESGWGSSALALQAKNLFGVKADRSWVGPTITMQTREFLNGQWVMVPAKWRAYDDWSGCMGDHAAFLRGNPRYSCCFRFGITSEDFATEVAKAGYATDPDYASKVISVIRFHNLGQYDQKG